MRKFSILVLVAFLGLAYFGYSRVDYRQESLISPIAKDSRNPSLNQWIPKQVLGIFTNVPKITAKSAFFVETKSGEVLFAKEARTKLPIASLTKVMTVLVALEHKNLDDQYSVSQRASEMEPDEMILFSGETLTLKELLYGVFLVSANDAAEVLAEETVESREQFINLMNDKANLLGMEDTKFVNPTGLDEDSNNSYSTAYDLAILTRYLIKHYPEVVNISSTYHIYLPASETHQDYDMYSGINLITTYQGVVGFKTGFTPEAGMTLITLARKNDHEVIGVLLGSESRRDEAKELLDYSFGKL